MITKIAGNIVVGSTDVYLNNTQDASRERETNIGNFVADSMLYEVRTYIIWKTMPR